MKQKDIPMIPQQNIAGMVIYNLVQIFIILLGFAGVLWAFKLVARLIGVF